MEIRDQGIALEGGGMCPVQFEGTVDGYPAYFRARHTSWCFTIAETEDAAIGGSEDWGQRNGALVPVLYEATGEYDPDGSGYGAGYMPLEDAERFIRGGVAAFRGQRKVKP